MTEQESNYDASYMPIMDLVWGKGFIAPGGEGNVDRIVEGVGLAGKRMLEPGSGAGGGTLVLARKHGARVVGLELEAGLVELSRQLSEAEGYADQIEFRCVEPGPLPVEDESFDALYTSGVICHIPDRPALFADILRILKPGGWLLGYDWFMTCSSPAIDAWLTAAELHITQATLDSYLDAMRAAGFVDVESEDASGWYLEQAARELAELEGPLYDEAARAAGVEHRDAILAEWRAMNRVLKSGELKSGYFRGRKPG